MRRTTRIFRTVSFFVIVLLASFFQRAPVASVAGVKPNLAFVLLAALAAVVPGFLPYLFLVLVADITLRFGPVIERVDIAFIAVCIAAYWLIERLPGKLFLNYVAVVAFGTVAFYAIGDVRFFIGFTATVFGEVVYNVIVGCFAYLGVRAVFKDAQQSRAQY
jgi:hypothetical protein